MKKKAEMIIRGMFQIIESCKGDQNVTSYLLALLDGILEDKRSRINLYSNVMSDFKDPVNCIKIINSFIQTNVGGSAET